MRGYRSGFGSEIVPGKGLLTIDSTPAHDAAAYQNWFEGARSADPRGKSSLTGTKLYRAVLMVRSGKTAREAATRIGVTGATLKRWFDKMPEGMRP